jgi:glycosyltransferase involved in cell wall biosynthesis
LNRVRWALDRHAKYIGLSNNDVTFATPVLGPLLQALQHERRLGIVAPTQIVAKRKPPYKLAKVVKYRSSWDLGSLQFDHDISCPNNQPLLLESDFCEFTTAIIPSAVFLDVGLLDEQFAFYYEDADFCFRAALKGWRSAYLQTSQIIHYEGSTLSLADNFNKHQYLVSNRQLFHRKHSVPGVLFEEGYADELSSWPIPRHFLLAALQKYGLIDKHGPKMIYNHPNEDDYEILFSIWETDELPKRWIGRLAHYRHILVASNFNRRVFERYHSSVHKIGLGVEPDYMNPWGSAYRFSDSKVFLSVFRQQYRKAFDVTVKAWIESGLQSHNCELVAYSPNLDHARYMSGAGQVLRNADFTSVFDSENKIRYVRPNREIAFCEMSSIYRSADFLVLNSRSEGFGLTAVEAMACGVPCIIPDYGATEEFVSPNGCITIGGRRTLADYTDKGFSDVGYWWEPDAVGLTNAFRLAASLSEAERTAIAETGRQHVLSNFTWRHCAVRFHEFCKLLSPTEKSIPPIPRVAGARRFWIRQLRRIAFLAQLLRGLQFGRVLIVVGRFLQRRGY